jgi:hypothetical protein
MLALTTATQGQQTARRGGETEAANPKKTGYSSRAVSHYVIDRNEQGDTVAVGIHLNRVYCFSRPMDMSRHRKLIRDFRKVYPLSLVAKQTMAGFEEKLLALPTRKAQREFSKQTEKELIAQYTPTLKRMTVSQGRILVRLIDRETDQTSYQIVREFRGGFVAGFWQGVARIFGHNLKDEYDPAERDRLIEQCIVMYNAGLLPEY